MMHGQRTIRLITAVLLFAAAGMLPLAAQDDGKKAEGPFFKSPSEYYYVNVALEKVYTCRKGYMVVYRKGLADFGRAYLPMEWFNQAGGKGELIQLPAGSRWPSLSIYYKNGEFSHCRLYVRRDIRHESWGSVPAGTDTDANFDGVNDLRLQFD